MMAMLTHWLGLDSPTPNPTPQPSISISSGKKKPRAPSSTPTSPSPARKTKSDELLCDFEVMRFLATADERLKEHGDLLSRDEVDRLETMHAQAVIDECGVLADIVEHLELENEKLRYRLALASPSSAAAGALMARRNALVY